MTYLDPVSPQTNGAGYHPKTDQPPRRVPLEELDRRLKELLQSGPERAQELARYLATCGWSAPELFGPCGKSQQWVSRQVLFGRFLIAAPNGVETRTALNKLAEYAFRVLWLSTSHDDTEPDRFADVAQMLKIPSQPSKALAEKILAKFADGKSHSLESMASKLEVSAADVTDTIRKYVAKGPNPAKVEETPKGVRPHFRIFKQDRMISFNELITKLGPVVEELVQQGKTNPATVSIQAIAACAHTLKKQFEEWSK